MSLNRSNIVLNVFSSTMWMRPNARPRVSGWLNFDVFIIQETPVKETVGLTVMLCHAILIYVYGCKPCVMSWKRVMCVTLECHLAKLGSVNVLLKYHCSIISLIYFLVQAMQSRYLFTCLLWPDLLKLFQITRSTTASRLPSPSKITTTSYTARKSAKCYLLSKWAWSFSRHFIHATHRHSLDLLSTSASEASHGLRLGEMTKRSETDRYASLSANPRIFQLTQNHPIRMMDDYCKFDSDKDIVNR